MHYRIAGSLMAQSHPTNIPSNCVCIAPSFSNVFRTGLQSYLADGSVSSRTYSWNCASQKRFQTDSAMLWCIITLLTRWSLSVIPNLFYLSVLKGVWHGNNVIMLYKISLITQWHPYLFFQAVKSFSRRMCSSQVSNSIIHNNIAGARQTHAPLNSWQLYFLNGVSQDPNLFP